MILREPTFKVIRAVEHHYKDGSFEVVEPLEYVWAAKKCVVQVETGFVTNFASVPIGFRNIFPINGRHRLAAVAHDYLYSAAGEVHVTTIIGPDGSLVSLPEAAVIYYDRKGADEVFQSLMLAEKVNKYKSMMMYLAVRMFGQRYWGKI